MRTTVLLFVSLVLVCGRAANADPPANFPLLRIDGVASALDDVDENFATATYGSGNSVLTGTAEIIPDIDDWVTLAQMSAATMCLNHGPGVSGAAQTLEVLDNNVNSPHGGVLGLLMTVVGGNGSAWAGIATTEGEGFEGISIQQNPNGIFVAHASGPVSVSAVSGVPLEITLPVDPGEFITMFAGSSVPAGTADQGSGTAAASAVPFDTPPLARVVVRSILGEIIDEWEADPPEDPPCP